MSQADLPGQITVTAYDSVAGYIAGTFSAKLRNKETGQVVGLTDGRSYVGQ